MPGLLDWLFGSEPSDKDNQIQKALDDAKAKAEADALKRKQKKQIFDTGALAAEQALNGIPAKGAFSSAANAKADAAREQAKIDAINERLAAEEMDRQKNVFLGKSNSKATDPRLVGNFMDNQSALNDFRQQEARRAADESINSPSPNQKPPYTYPSLGDGRPEMPGNNGPSIPSPKTLDQRRAELEAQQGAEARKGTPADPNAQGYNLFTPEKLAKITADIAARKPKSDQDVIYDAKDAGYLRQLMESMTAGGKAPEPMVPTPPPSNPPAPKADPRAGTPADPNAPQYLNPPKVDPQDITSSIPPTDSPSESAGGPGGRDPTSPILRALAGSSGKDTAPGPAGGAYPDRPNIDPKDFLARWNAQWGPNATLDAAGNPKGASGAGNGSGGLFGNLSFDPSVIGPALAVLDPRNSALAGGLMDSIAGRRKEAQNQAEKATIQDSLKKWLIGQGATPEEADAMSQDPNLAETWWSAQNKGATTKAPETRTQTLPDGTKQDQQWDGTQWVAVGDPYRDPSAMKETPEEKDKREADTNAVKGFPEIDRNYNNAIDALDWLDTNFSDYTGNVGAGVNHPINSIVRNRQCSV
jgi:hypothetical protein